MNIKEHFLCLTVVIIYGAEIRVTKTKKPVEIIPAHLDSEKLVVTNVSQIFLYAMEILTVKMAQTKRIVKRIHAQRVMLNVEI